jgi:membrane fusion protein, multidrug efflux system
MRAFNSLLNAILVTLVLGITLTACSSHAEPAQQRPTPVRAQAAILGPAKPAITTNGIVATKDEMRLSFKVAGLIKKIYVEEGQTVHRGERLAEIELTEIDAQVAQVRALTEKAQRDLDRGERLYADQVISLEQLQDLRTQAAAQKAQLRGVEFNRGYSVIAAPQDGVVLRKLSQERELVPAGQAVLVIGAHDRGYVVRAGLSDREVVQLKLGDPAEILMDAYPGRPIGGTITEIANAADEKSGLFVIEVRFGSTPVRLASGLVAKLRVYPASAREAALVYVPISAVVEGDRDRANVFVINGDRVKRREVRVAFIDSAGVAIASGLQAGEHVVTDGAPYLEDQEQIEVQTP